MSSPDGRATTLVTNFGPAAGARARAQHRLYISYDRLRTAARRPKTSTNSKILFVHVPKCAGVSMRSELRLPNKGHRLFCEIPVEEKNAAETILCCTRDPFDRAVSTYHYVQRLAQAKPFLRRLFIRLDLPPTFDEFVQSGLLAQLETHHFFFKSQFQYLKGLEDYSDAVVHLTFEDLRSDFKRHFGRELPRMNSAPARGTLAEPTSPETRERVRDIYKADYELLPRLIEQFPGGR